MAYEQLQNFAVCQVCGRVLTRTAAKEDGWLIAPSRIHYGIDIIRCFRHITRKSLDTSYAGATKYWMGRMREGQVRASQETQTISPFAEPFPLTDEV